MEPPEHLLPHPDTDDRRSSYHPGLASNRFQTLGILQVVDLLENLLGLAGVRNKFDQLEFATILLSYLPPPNCRYLKIAIRTPSSQVKEQPGSTTNQPKA